MKGGALPAPFSALSFHDWKSCWAESFPVINWQSLGFTSRPYGSFLYHNHNNKSYSNHLTTAPLAHGKTFTKRLWYDPKICAIQNLVGWLVVFGLNCPLRQYFSLYQAVSQREGERKEK